MAQGDIFLTRQGYEEKKKEYEHLTRFRRRELADAIEKARLLGDLRENAEYHAAKEAQAHNERRIAELENIISRARIVESENVDADKALIGATVKLRCLDDGELEEYTLVSEAEADFSRNKLSVSSPLGKGLVGHKKGAVVEVRVPAGVVKYEILEITRD
ncbi:MAG: transcription elongation factor GreA [Candidatus Omnitrophica bacterium]|nr:transcription elongation factor GreA [Candidatus Omnitrophota bacterium]